MKNKINEEILRIKEVMGLVSESFGIPDNIFKTSENVYEKIEKELKPYFNRTFFRKNVNVYDSNITINFNLPIKFNETQIIGKSSFDEINLMIIINLLTNPREPEIKSWGSMDKREVVPVDVYRDKKKVQQKDGQIKQITKFKKIKINPHLAINIIAGSNYNPGQIFNKLFTPKNKLENISVLSHELKHWYDSQQIDFENTNELIKYVSTSQTLNIPVILPSLNKLFFLLYYCSNIENSVRVVEIRSRYPELNKQNFWSIIKKTELYENMIMARDFESKKFEVGLKSEIIKLLNEYMSEYGEIKPDEFMKVVQTQISNKINKFFNNFKDSYEEMGRDIPKSERNFFTGTKDFEKILKFFEKILNKSSDKILRIIGKIYSSLP